MSVVTIVGQVQIVVIVTVGHSLQLQDTSLMRKNTPNTRNRTFKEAYLRADAIACGPEQVQIVVVEVAVATKIRLEAVTAIRRTRGGRDEDIIMRVVESRPIVIVNGHAGVVVGQNPVVADSVILFHHGGLTVSPVINVYLTVPAVKRAVIRALAAKIEEHIVGQQRTPTHTIIKVH